MPRCYPGPSIQFSALQRVPIDDSTRSHHPATLPPARCQAIVPANRSRSTHATSTVLPISHCTRVSAPPSSIVAAICFSLHPGRALQLSPSPLTSATSALLSLTVRYQPILQPFLRPQQPQRKHCHLHHQPAIHSTLFACAINPILPPTVCQPPSQPDRNEFR
jgi:hypothetical protein